MGHLRLIVGLFLSLAFGPCMAVGGLSVVTPFGPAVQYTTANAAQIIYGGRTVPSISAGQAASLSRAYGLGSAAGDVAVTDAVAAPGIGLDVAEVVASRTVAASVLPQVAVAAAAFSGGFAVGSALYNWYHAANLQPDSSGSGGFVTMTGAQASTSTTYTLDNKAFYGSGYQACNAYMQAAYQSAITLYAGYGYTAIPSAPTYTDASPPTCKGTYSVGGSVVVIGPSVVTVVAQNKCYDVDTGLVTISPTGGLCPQGTLSPLSSDQAQSKLAVVPPPDPVGVVKEAVTRGVPVPAGPVSLTGPASKPSGTVTTTTSSPSSGGSPSTTTTNVTNNYNYAGDTITRTQNVTTINNDGSTTTTTNTTPPDQRSECDKNPDTIGCTKFGDLPTNSPTWQSKTVTWASEDLGVGGSCPAPRDFSIRGWHMVMSYTPACNVAPTIAIGLQLLTALGCMLFIVQAVKT